MSTSRWRFDAHDDPSSFYGVLGAAAGALLALLAVRGDERVRRPLVLTILCAAGPALTSMAIRRKAWAPETVENRFLDAEEVLAAVALDESAGPLETTVQPDFEPDQADLPVTTSEPGDV